MKETRMKPTELRWIAVTERLPETHTPVLVWIGPPNRHHTIAWIERIDTPYVPGQRTRTRPGPRRVLWEVNAGLEKHLTQDVTHWMPLPLPPDGRPWPWDGPNAMPHVLENKPQPEIRLDAGTV